MTIIQTLKKFLGLTKEVPARKDLTELTSRLNDMRGDNITVVDSAGNIAPNRDGITHLANAARDARYIDRSNEDDLISDLTSYKTSK